MDARLTDKQKRFVTEYLVDLNATQAAIRAGYSKKTADRIGPELLGKTCVSKAIQEAIKRRESRTEITQDRVLTEYARIAFFDPRKLFDDDGNPKPISELSEEAAAAISQLDVDTVVSENGTITYTKKYRFSDKLRALEMTGRHLGMFDGKGGAIDTLARLDEVLRMIGGVE